VATFNRWQISAVVMSKGIGDTLMHSDRPAVKLGSSAGLLCSYHLQHHLSLEFCSQQIFFFARDCP
jgi:hypothetical protein